jgi:hypothetical protein
LNLENFLHHPARVLQTLPFCVCVARAARERKRSECEKSRHAVILEFSLRQTKSNKTVTGGSDQILFAIHFIGNEI